MKKRTLILLIILFLSVPVLAVVYGYFWIRGFTGKIYKQKDCSFAVVDNIEVHTGINIPATTNTKCEYDPSSDLKMVMFDLDSTGFDPNTFIEKNKFKKLDSLADLSFDHFLELETDTSLLVKNNRVYYTKGSYEKETWKLLLDPGRYKLWVTIRYQG